MVVVQPTVHVAAVAVLPRKSASPLYTVTTWWAPPPRSATKLACPLTTATVAAGVADPSTKKLTVPVGVATPVAGSVPP